MRIGIDARLWNETGVGRYIRNLVWQLQELDKINTYVLFVDKSIKKQELRIKENWNIVETDIRWHTLEEQRKFPKVLEKENLDLVHFPYFSVPIRYNRPFVITIHDLIIHHYPTGKASTLPSPAYYAKLLGYKFVIKKAAQKAQKVITVSQATKDEIVKHLHVSKEKVEVTYEGVEEKIYSSSERRRIEKSFSTNEDNRSRLRSNNNPYFLYVGNAYPHKNLDRLVEAFSLIVKDYPEVKLILIGKEDYFYKRLKENVKTLGIEKNIIFTGFVSEEDLQNYYHHALATIVPSLMEGFGLPGLEAMQAGCLVLASDIPSLKEIYQDAAIYFDPLAVKSLHATIQKVLDENKSFQSYIAEGRKRVAFFSWKKMAEETLKIYESSSRVRSDQ
jgi:glycosyltransferase involved in cell wall biosynthesis